MAEAWANEYSTFGRFSILWGDEDRGDEWWVGKAACRRLSVLWSANGGMARVG